MGIVKRLLLYIVCFYYCVLTPGTDGGKGNTENLLWEIVTVSIIQAFIAAGLFAFFDWPTTMFPWIVGEGFLGLLGTVGLVAGLWTLIGGLTYPSLEKILESDKEEARTADRKAGFLDHKQKMERIAKERRAFEQYSRENPQEYYDLLVHAMNSIIDGKREKIKYELLKDIDFVSDEKARLSRIL